VAGTELIIFCRPADETAESFKERLLGLAADVASDDRATSVVLLVDDGDVGAPPEASSLERTFDAALVVAGVPGDALPGGDASLHVSRRVIKARRQGETGQRSTGFTLVCPTVRAEFVDHEEFAAHWHNVHSKVHMAWSPGTRHYEQLIIDSPAGTWDGVGLLSFENATDYRDGLFSGPAGQTAIMDDVARFADFSRGERLPTSEFVFRDDGA
jgi:EthD domain